MTAERSTLRKVAAFTTHDHKRATVYRDADMDEYVVRLSAWVVGTGWKASTQADYFTGDKSDAMGTACVMLGLPGNSPKDAEGYARNLDGALYCNHE